MGIAAGLCDEYTEGSLPGMGPPFGPAHGFKEFVVVLGLVVVTAATAAVAAVIVELKE